MPAKAGKGCDMKLYKSTKENEVYYYFNSNNDKLWMYRHKYYDSANKRKEKKRSGFKTEKAAIKALLEVKAQTLRGETKYIENDNLTVGQWLDIWYNSNKKKWKVGTQIQREMVIRRHLKPLLGHYKLQKLDKRIYEGKFINVIESKYKTNTVRLWHNLFKIAINAAVEEEILPRNRFTRVNFAETNAEESVKFFSPSELTSFIEYTQLHENITYYTFFIVAAFTGMRRGELLGLQWNNIDFENNTISVERTRDDKGIRSPKTKNSYRTIPVDIDVIKQLVTYQLWCKKKLFQYGRKLKDKNDDTLIFISEHGATPISVGSTLYTFKKISKSAGLPEIPLHGLRHTHATILLNRDVNVKLIAERLGNTSDMIYKVYGHILKEKEQESVSVFSEALKASGAKIGAN